MKNKQTISVSMIGTLPPLKALSAYCLELVKALDHKVFLTFFSFKSVYPSFAHPTREQPNDHSFPEVRLKNTRIKTYLHWGNPFSWIRASLENKSDIFHVQWWSFPTGPIVILMALVCKFRKIPVITTIHNVSSHETSILFAFFSRLVTSLSDYFIVHSHHNKDSLIKNIQIDPHKVFAIPHGPLDFFRPEDFDEQTLNTRFRHKYNIHPEEKILLLFGAIRPYKNLELILNALKDIADHIKVKLVIAGSLWEDWAKYETIIKKNNIEDLVVTALHYIPAKNVSTFFAAADLVLLPYDKFNSQSGVGTAALSFEKPMIVGNCGGLPDLVLDDFCILKKKTPAALASKVVKILSDDQYYKKLSHDSKAIKESISWKRIADKTLAAYQQILNRKQKI